MLKSYSATLGHGSHVVVCMDEDGTRRQVMGGFATEKEAQDWADRQPTLVSDPCDLHIGVQRLTPVRFREDHPSNQEFPFNAMIGATKQYAILAEYGNIRHYLILDIANGRLLPGLYHLDRFEKIPEDEV